MSGPHVAEALTKMAQVVDQAGIDTGCSVNIEYVEDGDKLIPGDLIPVVTLSLVRQKEAVEPVPADAIDVEPNA